MKEMGWLAILSVLLRLKAESYDRAYCQGLSASAEELNHPECILLNGTQGRPDLFQIEDMMCN
jgi:hypothetical protein